MGPLPQTGRAGRTLPGGGLLLRLRRFVDDRSGVGAIEFAIVAPLLIMAYIGAFEVSVAVATSRKVSRAASTISDLLTQNKTTTKATLDTMKEVAKNVLAPYSITGYTMKITGIAVDADGNAKIAWSRNESAGTPYTSGDPVTLPSSMDAKSTFIVRTELTVPHSILLMTPGLDSNLTTINLSKTSYFRQRVGDAITCSNC